MSSIIKVNTVQDTDGNNIINENANTITVGAAGDTVDVPGTEVKTNKISPTSGTGLQLGDSGDTITIPSGATLANSGSVTGIPASAISSGTIATARLGSGTASSSTFLRGDSTFAAAPGGSLVHLNTSTGSNVSQIDIDGHFTSDYDHYWLVYSVYAATSNTDTHVRIMQGGSAISSSNYWYAGSGWYFDGSTAQSTNAQGFNASFIGISSTDNTADAQYPTTGTMLLSNPLSTANNTTIVTSNIGYNSGSPPNAIRAWNYSGTYISTTATSGISFQYDGGNINGTIRLYGIANS